MNIGIYIDNRGIQNVDCKNLNQGNPGIGGTEYCILLLAEAYKKFYPDDKVLLFCRTESLLPQVDDVIIIDSILALPESAKNKKCDMLIMAYVNTEGESQNRLFQEFSRLDLKLIVWGHNYYFENDCKIIADRKCIVANVFVGKQQYDRYIDNQIAKKSTFIYNMYPNNNKNYSSGRNEHIVSYIGSLIPSKGFHILAGQWKKILRKVPDAELYVIGSGRLYNHDQKLGKYNIAEESYEDCFMPFLVDINGVILKSVHFMGVLGREKEYIIRKTKVGIVNPSGRTETFGISALDFESYGIPVVSIAKGGFLDTIQNNKTGLLYYNKKGLYRNVVSLLKDNYRNERLGYAAFEFAKSFSIEKIIIEWNRLFDKVKNGDTIDYIPVDTHYFKGLKLLRLINKKIKSILGVKNGFSIIWLETIGWKILRKFRLLP